MLLAVLISGPAASGKSTLGAALAARLGAALLDQDVLTGPLTSVVGALVGSDDLDDPVLAGPTRAARYEALLATAVDNLQIGRPVVAVAPFTAERSDPAAWAAVRDRLVAAGGSPVLVWLRLDPDELLRRLRSRGAARDRAKLADPTAFLATGVLTAPRTEHLELDASWPVERLATTLQRFLAPRS
ncbi:AAA family ATPase [Pseudonocardia acaciae]|uniref:AAA family ATPase n=1 Tax=Pseudonocardia acaciae TaxID=551276 RepID=UPI000685BA2B|nr:AAA family ATPase [Pseudonocardia acaciae]